MEYLKNVVMLVVVAFIIFGGTFYGVGLWVDWNVAQELNDQVERHSFYEKIQDEPKRKVILYNIENYQGYRDSTNQKGTLNELKIHAAIQQMRVKYPEGDEIIVTGVETGFRDSATIVGHYKKDKPGSFLFVDHGWSKKAPPKYQKEINLFLK